MDTKIIVEEKGLSFNGHPSDAKSIAEEIRQLADDSHNDLSTHLGDFVFCLEAEYQLFYGLDQDDWGRSEKDPKIDTVKASELSAIKMVAGNEKRYPVVIDNGIVKEWVGIGWVDSHLATDDDYKKFPVVVF